MECWSVGVLSTKPEKDLTFILLPLFPQIQPRFILFLFHYSITPLLRVRCGTPGQGSNIMIIPERPLSLSAQAELSTCKSQLAVWCKLSDHTGNLFHTPDH